MRNVFIVLVLIVAVGVGMGFYLGWFKLSSRNDAGQPNVTLTVDKDKIEADKDKVVEKVQDLGQKAADKTPETTPKSQD